MARRAAKTLVEQKGCFMCDVIAQAITLHVRSVQRATDKGGEVNPGEQPRSRYVLLYNCTVDQFAKSTAVPLLQNCARSPSKHLEGRNQGCLPACLSVSYKFLSQKVKSFPLNLSRPECPEVAMNEVKRPGF